VHELKEMEGHLMAKGIGVLYKPFDVDELLDLVSSKLLSQESVNEQYRDRTSSVNIGSNSGQRDT
jgi:hypothetical protein